ncbi:kisspeptin 2 [Labeo rohita]|uniref:Kisspeptin 2 n=2 Tax=Labeo rohita TaxID=84645 RepID=A0A0D3LNX0_LABRO|nr:kisspeptin 2 [Labeo rohita]AHN05517.1 kisspeptin 2 [Labeo rohita]KAI2665401.1 Metastasis-suppressor KiSS-1 [Labeo rohita]RXN17744.1 kisspeptin 2 [Labeo rohita]
MKIKALILFMSAMICQSTALRAPFTDMDTTEPIPDSKQQYLSMERRQFDEPSASDDASLCFFFQEKDESSHISCKHRLTRSKFNYNPFGLRFGKRNEATTTERDRPKHKHLLPMMLYLRKQLETS